MLVLEVNLKIYNSNIKREIDITNLLEKYKIDMSLSDITSIYSDHSRFYHTFSHITTLLKDIEIDDDRLILAIIFHDIVYGANIENHEEKSAVFFQQHCNYENKFIEDVKHLIVATTNISYAKGELESEIIRVDRKVIHAKDISTLITWESQIFREFQRLSVNEYKLGRTAFLKKAYEETGNSILLELRDIVKNKVYKIGFYPGSFNPFHVGHFNILLKAEKSFDKVIIGVGVNFDKKGIDKVEIAKSVRNREIIYYSGLITTEIEKLSEHGEVFVVRGLRNAYDLQHEEGLRNVIKDFLPNQEFVYFFCNREYEHISSSLIRDIQSRIGENSMAEKIVKQYYLD